MSTRNTIIWFAIAITVVASAFTALRTMVESSEQASRAVPVIDQAPVADAAVTNCAPIYTATSIKWSGKCTSTTASYPYTTQFAVMARCYSRYSSNNTVWVTSGWWSVSPYYRAAYCPSGFYVDARVRAYYLFR